MKIDIILPVYNEAKIIENSVDKLIGFLRVEFYHEWKIIIADNGSTDDTLKIANKISCKYPQVSVIHIEEKGRGRALKAAWNKSQADILSYMDADLSTDVSCFSLLINNLIQNSDISVGSRLNKNSVVKRSLFRTSLSVAYNFLIKFFFNTVNFSDAQCGFKAAKKSVAADILPKVRNGTWFFDTEFLILAEKENYRIKETPVVWFERENSTVKILSTIFEDIFEIIRLRLTLKQRFHEKKIIR